MNTLKQARLSASLSQQELAIQAGVSRHSIIRLEQYCYPTPLPNVVDTLADVNLIGLSDRALTDAYLSEVGYNRQHTGEIISLNAGWVPLDYVGHHPSRHPFASWRIRTCHINDLPTSAIAFSKMLSIHPAVLSKYESFKTGFPHAIEVALSEAGCPAELLLAFRTYDLFNHVGD